MSELLECLELQDRHHMSDMDDTPRWIDTELYDEFFSCAEAPLEIRLIDDARDSLGEEVMYSFCI